MNKFTPIETERRTLLPRENRRDGAAFLDMLREDGDFQLFCGAPFGEENLRNFSGYLQRGYRWAMYRRGAPDALLGYVGLDKRLDSPALPWHFSSQPVLRYTALQHRSAYMR